jgi:adenosylhomocysteinase
LTSKYQIKNIDLSPQGDNAIYLAESRMPTLSKIKRRFEKEKPLKGVTIGACLHVTKETGVLAQTLKAGGAKFVLCGSNPLSTQDDVAAALVKEGFNVYAWRNNDSEYYNCINSVLDHKPDILIDDGADLIVIAHKEKSTLLEKIIGGQEETTTGVNRLRVMYEKKALNIPVIAVNDAFLKTMFDNRYGTGQGVVSAISALNILFAGKNVVVAGYGPCSWGMATRARGLGANVIVTEVNPMKALEAVMDGYRVLPMEKAVLEADMVFTSTGCKDVVVGKHFEKMKDGVILANLGHFNIEISVKDLEKMSSKKKRIREYVDEYTFSDGKRLYLLGEGRLANLVILGGHPSEIMDLSFSVQALTAEFLVTNRGKLENKVYTVPDEIDKEIAKVKLETMNIQIDSLTDDQEAYIKSFEIGT